MHFLHSTLKFLLLLFEVVMAFNLIILVHELGHYWAALWRGLKVEKFQIWFGPRLWKKTINGVQWGLGSIPFGGFVALPQMAPMEMLEGKSPDGTDRRSLPPVKPLDKIIVAFAGPLFSFLLALVCAFGVWKVGRPVNSQEVTRVVGWVDPKMPAAAPGGLRPGDEILEVDGNPVQGFGGMTEGIVARVAMSEGKEVVFKIRRPGVDGTMNVSITPETPKKTGWFERSEIRQVGVAPQAPAKLKGVLPNSPAELGGLHPGDRLIEIDGQPIYHPAAITDRIEAKPDEPLALTVTAADGSNRRVVSIKAVKPLKSAEGKPMLGIVWGDDDSAPAYPTPVEQIKKAGTTVFKTAAALLSPRTKINASQLSGPVGIGGLFYDLLLEPQGWKLVLWFFVVVNVNLAIFNLLPLPILDGGHITLSLLEWIRRRAVSPRFLEVIQTGFAVLILGFMLYITIIDVRSRKDASPREAKPPPEVVFPPPAAAQP